MIDSHCHLDHDPLFNDLDNVINRAKNVGVKKFLTICTNSKSYENILKFINKYPDVYATFGIHPHETENEFLTKNKIIEMAKTNNKIIGIGESGLDFYYDNSLRSKQIDSFINHIEASIELNKPIIVHSRNAENETFQILNDYKNSNLKILMHCFTGSQVFASKLMKLNTYFSASGIITFKNSKELQETFSKIPLEKLLVETDSPFLAPVPMRGKKNEPSFIKYTLEKLSVLKNVDFKIMDSYTTKNFNSLFLK